MNLYQIKIYLRRLGNAILGKEFKEGRYLWSLYDYIMELVVEFIDKGKHGYPSEYTENQWNAKLDKVKRDIILFNEFDMNGLSLYQKDGDMDIKGYFKEYEEKKDAVTQGISDIFFNLWD